MSGKVSIAVAAVVLLAPGLWAHHGTARFDTSHNCYDARNGHAL